MRTRGIVPLVVVLCIAFALALTGCDKKSQEQAKTFKIGFIAKASNNPVFQSAHEGALAAAETLSRENSDVKVEVIIRTPSTEDASEQAKRTKELAEQGVVHPADTSHKHIRIQPDQTLVPQFFIFFERIP